MKVKFETIANEIRNVAKIIETPDNVCTIDYALVRLKSIVNQFENNLDMEIKGTHKTVVVANVFALIRSLIYLSMILVPMYFRFWR